MVDTADYVTFDSRIDDAFHVWKDNRETIFVRTPANLYAYKPTTHYLEQLASSKNMLIQHSQPTPVAPQPTSSPPEPTSTRNINTATDNWKYHGLLGHRPAPPKSGSTHQVLVNWEDHAPTYVNVNTFSDHGLNTENCTTLYQYAQTNNLLTTKGWKQFKKHAEPTPANHTSFCMTKQTVNFFEQALHAHQINKAVHPETGKLSEYPALLQDLMDITGKKALAKKLDVSHKDTLPPCQTEPTQCFL